jgi:hypothetical protein
VSGFYNRGPQSFGYYRGNPLFGGQGAGQGVDMAGSNSYAAGQGPGAGTVGGLHPSVIYMIVLVIVEMFVFAWLAKHV